MNTPKLPSDTSILYRKSRMGIYYTIDAKTSVRKWHQKYEFESEIERDHIFDDLVTEAEAYDVTKFYR